MENLTKLIDLAAWLLMQRRTWAIICTVCAAVAIEYNWDLAYSILGIFSVALTGASLSFPKK